MSRASCLPVITLTATRAVALLAAVVAGGLVSSCSPPAAPEPTRAVAASTSPAHASPAAPTAEPPRLLTWTRRSGQTAITDALVAGRLAVNDAGCVTVGHALLLAPPGSSVLTDAGTVRLAGHGEHPLGQLVRDLPGGYWDITGTSSDPAGITECRSHASPEQEYAVVWDV